MNLRRELYKQAHNIKSDEDVKEHDYIVWITDKLRQWKKLNAAENCLFISERQYVKFDEWLSNEVEGMKLTNEEKKEFRECAVTLGEIMKLNK
jgi:hypothetical protein